MRGSVEASVHTAIHRSKRRGCFIGAAFRLWRNNRTPDNPGTIGDYRAAEHLRMESTLESLFGFSVEEEHFGGVDVQLAGLTDFERTVGRKACDGVRAGSGGKVDENFVAHRFNDFNLCLKGGECFSVPALAHMNVFRAHTEDHALASKLLQCSRIGPRDTK